MFIVQSPEQVHDDTHLLLAIKSAMRCIFNQSIKTLLGKKVRAKTLALRIFLPTVWKRSCSVLWGFFYIRSLARCSRFKSLLSRNTLIHKSELGCDIFRKRSKKSWHGFETWRQHKLQKITTRPELLMDEPAFRPNLLIVAQVGHLSNFFEKCTKPGTKI